MSSSRTQILQLFPFSAPSPASPFPPSVVLLSSLSNQLCCVGILISSDGEKSLLAAVGAAGFDVCWCCADRHDRRWRSIPTTGTTCCVTVLRWPFRHSALPATGWKTLKYSWFRHQLCSYMPETMMWLSGATFNVFISWNAARLMRLWTCFHTSRRDKDVFTKNLRTLCPAALF